jgi:hypothetical protein
MSAPSLTPASASLAQTSVGPKLLNMLASPSEVIEEVVVASPRHANWLLPTLLVCVTGLILLVATSDSSQVAANLKQLSLASRLSTEQVDWLSKHWQLISGASVCLAAFAGLFWSAFVIWFLGRFPLKSRFPFLKALEIAGLTSSILVLGTTATVLLTLATGDVSARPALSLFLPKLDPSDSTRAAFDVLNVFHLWMTAVLALGLSKLAAASFREAAFWVFGYWVVFRLSVMLLV